MIWPLCKWNMCVNSIVRFILTQFGRWFIFKHIFRVYFLLKYKIHPLNPVKIPIPLKFPSYGTNTFKQRCPKASHKFTNIKGYMNVLIETKLSLSRTNPIASEWIPTHIWPTEYTPRMFIPNNNNKVKLGMDRLLLWVIVWIIGS